MFLGPQIKILIPRQIFLSSANEKELEEKVKKYLGSSFPGRNLSYVDEPFAICERKE